MSYKQTSTKLTVETGLQIGQKYRDTASGFTGICTALHVYRNGCVRATISGAKKDGDPVEYVMDDSDLALVADEPQAKPAPRRAGGPVRGMSAGSR